MSESDIVVPGVVARAATPGDTGFISCLFCDLKRPQFLPMGLPAEALETLLQQQFAAREAHYSSVYPEAETSIFEQDGQAIGFVIVNFGDQIRLVDIALVESHRGRGIGSAVLAGLTLQADALGQEIGLCVDWGSPAARLYERFDFVAISDENFNVQMVRKPVI